MNQLEHNLTLSFQRARADIIKLQEEIYSLKHQQSSMVAIIVALQERLAAAPQPPHAATGKKTNGATFVASKSATKFHLKNCPFAQNINPKTKITFKNKNAARNRGLIPCRCIK